MAIWFAKGNTQGTEATVYADDMSDVNDNLKKFATDNHLKRGSQCVVIKAGAVYLMDTDGDWHKF